MEHSEFSELSGRLNTISRLLAVSIIDGKKQSDQIRLLSKAGLEPKEIADIIGTSSNTVRVTLSTMRKRGQV